MDVNYYKVMVESFPNEGVSLLSDADPEVYSNLVFDGAPRTQTELDDLWIDCLRKIKDIEIDKKTVELISAGFSYDSNNFSLSETAQINWLGIKLMQDLLTFPLEVSTKNDYKYSLAEVNVDAFVGTGAAVKQAHLDSGRSLKVDVADATTEAEIDLIVDNR